MEDKNDNVNQNKKTTGIPLWRKYCLTPEETAQYTGIGENSIRKIIDNNRHADFILQIGNRIKIKRPLFEQFLVSLSSI